MSFGARLGKALETYGKLCVGIDPHPSLLRDWGLEETPEGLLSFGLKVVEAAEGRVGVVKPQVAFFERYGSAGMQVLARIQSEARDAGILVISDAKRGDIGSTMEAYAEAWLNPDSEFATDAVTLSPYLGFGSLQPAIDAAHRYGGGVFVLALTSNPEGQSVQLASQNDVTVASHIASNAGKVNRVEVTQGLGSVGIVVGATTSQLLAGEDSAWSDDVTPILAPGYGAQGATATQLREGFGSAYRGQVLVNASRSILGQGPDAGALVRAMERTAEDLSV